MGSPGSTRWNGYEKKLTVEQCLFLDINEIRREMHRGARTACVLKAAGMPWNIHGLTERVGSVGCEVVQIDDTSLILNLQYTLNHECQDQHVFENIMLQSTQLCSGGLRWWFTCPGMIDAEPCLRRVRKLYLPPGCIYFGCRHCYDLTYMSSQNPEGRVEMPEKVRHFLSAL